MGEMHTKY